MPPSEKKIKCGSQRTNKGKSWFNFFSFRLLLRRRDYVISKHFFPVCVMGGTPSVGLLHVVCPWQRPPPAKGPLKAVAVPKLGGVRGSFVSTFNSRMLFDVCGCCSSFSVWFTQFLCLGGQKEFCCCYPGYVRPRAGQSGRRKFIF